MRLFGLGVGRHGASLHHLKKRSAKAASGSHITIWPAEVYNGAAARVE
jgi:hypothetical protein